MARLHTLTKMMSKPNKRNACSIANVLWLTDGGPSSDSQASRATEPARCKSPYAGLSRFELCVRLGAHLQPDLVFRQEGVVDGPQEAGGGWVHCLNIARGLNGAGARKAE